LPLQRFHDLRRTAASLMLNHGIPVIVVSRRLGHAKAGITLDIYGYSSAPARRLRTIPATRTPIYRGL
jgi:integrase